MRLVEVGDVPGAGLDPEAVDDAARGLKADAGAVRDGGNDVAGAWAGLGASYEAPEAAQLLRVMDPVRADTDRLADELVRVASALATFAGELREVVTNGDRLRVEVAEFRARVAAAPVGGAADAGFGAAGFGSAGGSALGLDPVLATQNAFLTSRIAALAEELVEAERACAAAVRAVDGPPSSGGFGGFVAGAVSAVSDVAEKAANPWGESTQPELCAGAAIAQVMAGMWNSASWPAFALAQPALAKFGGHGLSPADQQVAWAEVGRSLIGASVSAAEDFVLGLGDRIDDMTGFAVSSPLTEVDGGDSDGREGQRQDSVSDGYGRGPEEQESAGAGDEHTIAGPQPYPDLGLGPGVPGTEVPFPEPPGWTPPDLGSDAEGDAHGSEEAGLKERANEVAIHHAANGMGAVWPNASRNLLHYLDNSGEDLEQPVDDMLTDLSDFRSGVEDREQRLGVLAIERARTSGATGPVSFPVNSEWLEHGYVNADLGANHNWYYGTGAFQYNLSGMVVVHPPEAPDGEWRYETETVVNYRDRYNWDGGKSVTLPEEVPFMGGEKIYDTQLQDLHKQGLAREFNMLGHSSRRTSKGTE